MIRDPLVDSIDVSRFPMKMRIDAYVDNVADAYPIYHVRVIMRVIERDSDADVEVVYSESAPNLYLEDENQRLRFIHSVVRKAVDHELDECFVVNGRRIFDPHKGMS